MAESSPDLSHAVTTDDPPSVPDYLATPNAVFSDEGVQWRYGRAPDYTKTRKVWAEGKKMNHAAGSLEEMVENLVKNWEVEASFKPRLSDWRTVDHANYSFAMGGGPPQTAEHMIQVGTYNGIIAPNEYYSPKNSDFASSHKTFKRMMPTFAWEVLEVYSGPPRVAFRWRHWGVMKNDYVGFNDKGEKITAKAHGGLIDIEGVTVAQVDDKVRLQAIQTWMDPLEMFRQIAPQGVVNKIPMNRKVEKVDALDDVPAVVESYGEHGVGTQHEGVTQQSNETVEQPVARTNSVASPPKDDGQSSTMTAKASDSDDTSTSQAQSIVEAAAIHGADKKVEKPASNAKETTEVLPPTEFIPSAAEKKADTSVRDGVSRSMYSSSVTGDVEEIQRAVKRGEVVNESKASGTYDAVDEHLEKSADHVHPHAKDVEEQVGPGGGEAVAAAAESEETHMTHQEMSSMSAGECPFLMNRE